MKPGIVLALVAALILGACSSNGMVPQAAQNAVAQPQALRAQSALAPVLGAGVTSRELCPSAPRGYARCFAIMRTDIGNDGFVADADFEPLYNTKCFKGNAVCYGPSDLWKAYNFPSTSQGKGQTIALVDAYDDPTAESDLATYRSQFGLSACTTANKCFRKVSATGSTTSFPNENSGWRGEESLDIDMASAVCPNCKIILVEATDNSFKHFEDAENEAVKLGATVISNSWGGDEYAASDPAYDHKGIAITASAGDDGYNMCYNVTSGCGGPQDPAAFDSVIAVGGTTMLPVSGTTRGFSETAWNCYSDPSGSCDLSTIYATASGCSTLSPKPAWETDTGCKSRSYNDVSAVADIYTGVWVRDDGEWTIYGGTSVASPIIAAAIALAGNAKSLNGAEAIWKSKGAHFYDVTSGNDIIPKLVGPATSFSNKCSTAQRYICYAGKGFDGPTGWGTPNGIEGL